MDRRLASCCVVGGCRSVGWKRNTRSTAGGVRAIRDMLQCSTEDAKVILGDLRSRKLVDLEITAGGQLDTREPMPWRSGNGFDQLRAIDKRSPQPSGLRPAVMGQLAAGANLILRERERPFHSCVGSGMNVRPL